MNRILHQAAIITCLLLALGDAAHSAELNPTLSDAKGNTRGGTNALPSSTGLNSTAFGRSALQNNTGSYNTATGSYALYSNTSYYNTATGYYALYSNTSGSNNTASGYRALNQNNTGTSNTATGGSALRNNATGNSNTASGVYALYYNENGSSNTASGVYALYHNTSGNNNTASGVYALSTNTNGDYNTAMGRDALKYVTGSSFNNLALGYRAGSELTSGSYNIYLGHSGVSTESNTLRLGSVQTRAFIAGIRGKTTGTANAVQVLIDSNGQLGTINSSRRFKEAIRDMEESSQRIFDLRPVTFRYQQPTDDGSKPLEYGLIAEEVAQVYPDLVAYGADGQIETVQYHKLTPMLLNELQRLNRQSSTQAQQLEAQTQQLAALKGQNESLRAELKAQNESLRAELKAQNESLRAVAERLQGLEAQQRATQVAVTAMPRTVAFNALDAR